MTDTKTIALKCTTDIVAAKVTNTTDRAYLESGKDVANYFEAIYDKIYEIASK